MPRNYTEGLIAAARAGDSDALGQLLEQHRERFRVVARQKLDTIVQGRIDPSDIIQQTFLTARRDFHAFQGTAEQQFVAWLNKILEHNISNTVQFHLRAYKRSVLRERQAGSDGDGTADIAGLPDDQISPSQRLAQVELRERVLHSMGELRKAEREAIRLRYLEESSLNEIATALGRSQQAAAGLLKRGLRRLREQMKTSPEEPDQ